MQLKISCFNKTLFRKNLTRFWPLWGMASFVGALFPMVMFMEISRGTRLEPLEMTEMYYNVAVYAVPVLSLFYAVMCALAVWHYLYAPRSVGMMHTLPITRKGLFLTNFLSGMAMMLIPYAVTGALTILISLVYGFFEPAGILATIAAVVADSFFYFASATVVAFVTGNVFALPVLYFIFHFLAVIMDFMVSTFATGFLFGLNREYNGVVEFLSPTVYLMSTTEISTEYEQILDDKGNHIMIQLSSVTLENGWVIALYAAVGVVLALCAWMLYRRRRSESAGDVVAVGWMKPVFRWGVTACCALLGGQGLYLMFLQTNKYRILPMTICMVVAGVIGYFAARMLLAKSLRVFRGSWKGVAVLAVLSAALCLGLDADAFGIENRVPEIDEVQEVEVYLADNTYIFYPGEQDELLEEVRALHAAVAADADYIEAYDGRYYETYSDSRPLDYEEAISRYNYFNITYKLKNGAEVSRRYNVPLTRDRMAQEGTYDHLMEQLVNSEAMKAKRLHFGDDAFTLTSGYLWAHSSGSYDFSTREAAQIHDAVYADLLAGNWGDYDFFGRSDGGYYDMNLEFQFMRPERKEGYSRYDHIHINVHPGMVNTVKCLVEMGVVTAEDLKTNAELYPEQYEDQNYQVWEKGYGELTSFPDYGMSSSIGIIGGADGPTTVFVAGVTDTAAN